MNTLSEEIRVIDENGIWQLVKEGDRYAVRTCYVYEDHESYDTYRLPNDLTKAVFTNYMEPSSCPLKQVRNVFKIIWAQKAVPIAGYEKLSLLQLNDDFMKEVTWEQLMDGTFGGIYPRLAERGLIEKADPSNSLLAALGFTNGGTLTTTGYSSLVFANRLLKVADQ